MYIIDSAYNLSPIYTQLKGILSEHHLKHPGDKMGDQYPFQYRRRRRHIKSNIKIKNRCYKLPIVILIKICEIPIHGYINVRSIGAFFKLSTEITH